MLISLVRLDQSRLDPVGPLVVDDRDRGRKNPEPASAASEKRHEEKQLGVEVDEYLPPGSSAVVAVFHDQWADRVEAALVKADKRINKAIDSDDYDELQKAISKSSQDVSAAINS